MNKTKHFNRKFKNKTNLKEYKTSIKIFTVEIKHQKTYKILNFRIKNKTKVIYMTNRIIIKNRIWELKTHKTIILMRFKIRTKKYKKNLIKHKKKSINLFSTQMLYKTQTIEDQRFLILKFLIKIFRKFKMSPMKIIKIKCNYNKKKVEV
jgi:hypothetical protein